MKEVENWFDVVIVKYICNDLKKLMEEPELSGPLFNSISRGIDALGGMILGFQETLPNGKIVGNSKKRSIHYMVDYMNLNEVHADWIYKRARCGVTHEGIARLLTLYNSKKYSDPLAEMFILNQEYLENLATTVGDYRLNVYFNIHCLANIFLNSVHNIDKKYLKYLPKVSKKDLEVHMNFCKTIDKNIHHFFDTTTSRAPYQNEAMDHEEILFRSNLINPIST